MLGRYFPLVKNVTLTLKIKQDKYRKTQATPKHKGLVRNALSCLHGHLNDQDCGGGEGILPGPLASLPPASAAWPHALGLAQLPRCASFCCHPRGVLFCLLVLGDSHLQAQGLPYRQHKGKETLAQTDLPNSNIWHLSLSGLIPGAPIIETAEDGSKQSLSLSPAPSGPVTT